MKIVSSPVRGLQVGKFLASLIHSTGVSKELKKRKGISTAIEAMAVVDE